LFYRPVSLWLLCACFICTQLPAQTPPPSEAQPASQKSPADQLVDQLVDNAERYRATLPSLTAHETILSETSETIVFGKSAVHAEATIRVVRKTSGGPLEESRQIIALNGKPIASDKRVGLPLTISGGFGHFPAAFFSPENRPCFNFVLSPRLQHDAPLELSISLNPDASELPQCKPAPTGLAAIARVDPATHQLIHLERTFPDDPEASKSRMLFLSVDLAPTLVGQNTFWLPTTLVARGVNGKNRLSWISHYSDYHQFAATATILPATSE
jgi:hypothetical protein